LVRYTGTSHIATGILNFRIDSDYREPHGGYLPVKVNYSWEENGKPMSDVHIVRQPEERYTITCSSKPLLKSIILELAGTTP
jgi:hypothetical protein